MSSPPLDHEECTNVIKTYVKKENKQNYLIFARERKD